MYLKPAKKSNITKHKIKFITTKCRHNKYCIIILITPRGLQVLELSLWKLLVAIIIISEAHYSRLHHLFGHHIV